MPGRFCKSSPMDLEHRGVHVDLVCGEERGRLMLDRRQGFAWSDVDYGDSRRFEFERSGSSVCLLRNGYEAFGALLTAVERAPSERSVK